MAFLKNGIISKKTNVKLLMLAGSMVIAAGLSGCNGSSSNSNSNNSSDNNLEKGQGIDLYDPNDVLDVEVTMSDSDWELLRHEGPQISEWSPACKFDGYNDYNATVTIEGETVGNVAVRKKGKIGGLTVIRPALTLNFGKGDENEGRTFGGDQYVSLNNNRQDLSGIKECLSLGVFESAGILSPRCNLARVTAQGVDLGVYAHVEPFNKVDFLTSAFGDGSGNLYQGSRSGDFLASRIPFFSKKTNKSDTDRSDLDAVVAAMEASDEFVWDELDKVINMDYFLTYSVVEALLGHSNGYSGYQNNMVIYNNPEDGRFYFIPKGTEQSLRPTYHLSTDIAPASAFLGSELLSRLWNTPGFQERYDNRMLEMLDLVWDEEELVSEASRLADLVDADAAEVQKVIEFIEGRREAVLAEIGDDSRSWDIPLMGEAEPCPEPIPFSGNFDIYWGDSPNEASEFFTSVDSENLQIMGRGFVRDGDRGDGVFANTLIMIGGSAEGDTYMVAIAIPPQLWGEGELQLHSAETTGRFSIMDDQGEWVELGLMTDGSVTFTEASLEDGGRVTGSFDASYVIFN